MSTSAVPSASSDGALVDDVVDEKVEYVAVVVAAASLMESSAGELTSEFVSVIIPSLKRWSEYGWKEEESRMEPRNLTRQAAKIGRSHVVF